MNIKPLEIVSGNQPEMPNTGKGCVMNICAYLNGEPHTDRPQCVSSDLWDWLQMVNDTALSYEQRQRLLPFVERLSLTGGMKMSQFCPESIIDNTYPFTTQRMDKCIAWLETYLPQVEQPIPARVPQPQAA